MIAMPSREKQPHERLALSSWDGLSLFRSRLGPGDFPVHEHPEIQVSIRMGLEAGGRAPLPNSLCVVESMQPHGGALPMRAEFVVAYFDPDRLAREWFEQTGSSAVRIMGCEGACDPLIEAALAEACGELHRLPAAPSGQEVSFVAAPSQAILEALTLWITTRLLHAHSDAGSVSRSHWSRVRPLTAQQFRTAIGMLSQTEERVSVAEVAEHLHLSTTGFVKAFRAMVGKPPHRYLMGLRASKARELLLNSRMPLARIAESCGYSSQSHMAEQLRRHAGMTPSAIRAARI